MMRKKIVTIILIGIGMLFSGCVSSQNLQPKTITLNGNSKSYEFIKIDPIDNREITKSELLKDLNLKADEILDIDSKYITTNENSFSMNFKMHVPMLCKSEVIINRDFKIIENTKSFIFTLFEPKQITIDKDAYWENMSSQKLCMPGRKESFVLNLASQFPNKIILKTKEHQVKGEINSKYPMKSVYSNLKRELRPMTVRGYKKSERITSDSIRNKFRLEAISYEEDDLYNKDEKSVDIKLYPYKNGTKIIYTMNFKYSIDSLKKPSLTKNDIKNTQKKLLKILND